MDKLNENLENFRIAFGGKRIVTVLPMDEAQMIVQECHHNVTKKQSESGGRSVLGFNFLFIGDEIFVNHHSVWETQDGTLVDVTLDEPCSFLPVKFFDARVEWYFTNALFRFPKNSEVFYANPIGLGWREQSLNLLRTAELETALIHHRDYSRLEDKDYIDYLEDNYGCRDEIV